MTEPMAADRRAVVEAGPRNRPLSIVVGEPARSCVVLLGTPHSGLSLCARLLGVLGMDMGDGLAPRAADTAGDGPADQVIEFHDRILDLFGRGYRAPLHDLQLPAAWWADPRLRPIQREIMAFLKQRAEEGRSFGIADPRLASLLPLWQQVFRDLKLTPKIVLCLRNPAYVARSLAERDGLAAELGEYRWLTSMVDIFKGLENYDTCIIEYENWFRDPLGNIEKLCGFLGRQWDQSEADLHGTVAEIVDPARERDSLHDGEARQPLVRSFYKLARRCADDAAARDGIQSTINQFILYRQLHRPLEAEFERLLGLAANLPEPRSEQEAGELAESRAQLAERDAALAEATERVAETARRLHKALAQRAQSDGELARAQQTAELRAGAIEAAETKLTVLTAERDATLAEMARRAEEAAARGPSSPEKWAEIPRPSFWRRLHSALGFGQAEKRRAATELAALRGALAEREGALGDAAGQLEEMAARLREAHTERADAKAALTLAERNAAGRRAAVAAAETELTALRATLAEREDALAEANDRAKEMAARLTHELAERADIEAALGRTKEEASGRDASVKAAEAELATLRSRLAEREDVLTDATDGAKEMAVRLERELTERAAIEANLADAKEETAEREAAVATAEMALAELREQLAKRESALAEATGSAIEMAARLQRALTERAEADGALARVQQEAAECEAAASVSFGALHDELTKREATLAEETALAKEMAARLAAAEAELAERDATTRTRFARLREELGARGAGLVEATDRAEEMAARLAAAEAELAERESAVVEATDRAEEMAARLAAAEAELVGRESAVVEATDRAEEMAARLAAAEAELAERESAVVEATDRATEIGARMAMAEAELVARDAALLQAERSFGDRDQAVAVVRAELISLQAELAHRKAELARTEQAATEWRGETATAQAELAALKDELAARNTTLLEVSGRAAEALSSLDTIQVGLRLQTES